MDYGGNWPDQNFSEPTYQDDPGPLRSARRSASPAAPEHLGSGGGGSSSGGGGPHVPRALMGRRPASAHASPAQHPPRQPSPSPVTGTRGGPAGEGLWRGASLGPLNPLGPLGSLATSPRRRRAEALAMALALAAEEGDAEDEEPPLNVHAPPSPQRRPRSALCAFPSSSQRGSELSDSAEEPTQVDVCGASVEARQTRGWPFEDPFPLTLRSLPTQIVRDLQNTSNDVSNVSNSRTSPVPSIRQTNSSLAKVFGSDPYLPAKRPWANLYLEDSLDYSQVRDTSTESQWNVYNEINDSNKHTSKDQPMKSVPLNWQFRADVDQSTLIPQHVNQLNAGSAMTSGCLESCVKAPRDYEALIRNMDEVEEREINACLREDFYSRVGDVGDWSEDSVRVDTVMLENFEELEQLIQEEDDDVQMALRIQDEKFPHQRRKKTNEYLESQKPVYQGNPDHDESDDDLSPEVAAAMMHSEEQGILMGSAPSRVYNALFSDCEKDLIAVSSACPFHPQCVVVPTAGGEIPYTASAEDLTALASVALGEEPPNGSVFSDTLKKRGSYDAVMIEASKPYTDEQIADSPDGTSLASVPPANLEYVLDPASPPSHFSKVQLRGSILPDWFPGYYKALPHIKGITAVCSNPGIVMEDAWWTLQTTIA